VKQQLASIALTLSSALLMGCGGGGNTSIDTTAPTFTSSDRISVSENQTSVLKVHAGDTSGVFYSISGGEDSSEFDIGRSSGELVFENAPDFEHPADVDNDNHYEVKITATDTANNTSTQTLVVTVTDVNEKPVNKTVTITDAYQVESLGGGGNIYATVKAGNTPKNLYILLSNSSKTQSASPMITHNAKVASTPKYKSAVSVSSIKQPKILHAPAYITNFNRDLHKRADNRKGKLLPAATRQNKDVAGDRKDFYLDADSTSNKTAATAKKVVTVSTAFGKKTLNVWVSNDSFGSGCEKVTCVTQEMVDTLADTFLKTGSDNDIYDWVTNIYGEEWGAEAAETYDNLVGANDEITILLTDIDKDNNKDGGTIGYFYPKDNYTASTASGSNQRVMFYIDSVMFANTDSGDTWQKEVYSTLAHEFTHMIEFYQKYTKLDSQHDDWIAEMLAETTEDLVATKIRHNGPRNVAYTDGSAGDPDNVNGRYPAFNENPTLSLTAWNNALADYSKVSAFGTFLTRNYGGAKVLHDIMYTAKEHEDLIESVTKKSFATLLREWGVAVMLSDIESPEDLPTYNTGDFTPDHYGSSTYQLGSINFFNYIPKPVSKTTTGTIEAEGNYYYKIGDSLTGDITIDLTLGDHTEATLIAKEVKN